jgi:hypothetical protein
MSDEAKRFDECFLGITEASLQYLRNIKTSPPGAGRSIDPSKPGPDDGLRSPARTKLEQLCADLRVLKSDYDPAEHVHERVGDLALQAAAEIERLAGFEAAYTCLRKHAEELTDQAWRREEEIERLKKQLVELNMSFSVDPLPRKHQDPSKRPTYEEVERHELVARIARLEKAVEVLGRM